jgi:hypothetical protein
VQASASAVRDADPAADYSRFVAAVARAQLTGWLAELPPRQAVRTGGHRGARGNGGREPPMREDCPRGQTQLLIDISGPGAGAAEAAARAGHTVLRIVEPGPAEPGPAEPGRAEPETPPPPAPGDGRKPADRLCTVAADGCGLDFLADACADGVIAEDRTLSRHLAAEWLVAEIARVLRPGGQVLACVDSLTFGMAVLAEQHRWPHLVDVPNADVVLVPLPDGTITRCYGAEQLRELFTGNGLEVCWIRPRTVFSPRTVSYLLARDPGSFGALVKAELRVRSDDSVGAQLVTCARRC